MLLPVVCQFVYRVAAFGTEFQFDELLTKFNAAVVLAQNATSLVKRWEESCLPVKRFGLFVIAAGSMPAIVVLTPAHRAPLKVWLPCTTSVLPGLRTTQ
jgi:hypothetical protein